MEIVWRRSALNDLEALREFIAQDNPRAAARIYAAIQAAVERLAAYPNLGRAGRVEGTRELIPNPVDRNLCCGCHCERSEAISSGNAHPDRDCFVAPLLAMTGRAWILIIRIWYDYRRSAFILSRTASWRIKSAFYRSSTHPDTGRSAFVRAQPC